MKLGQHFLVNNYAISKFISYIDLSFRPLIEIGGGSGNLTRYLNPDLVIEIDMKFSSHLPNLVIADARAIPSIRGQIVSSLPYYISFDFFEEISHLSNINRLSLILQYDFVKKIINEPTYISFLINYYFRVDAKDILPPSFFYPSPKVYSIITIFYRKKEYNEKINKLLKCISQYKNKKLANALELCNILYNENNLINQMRLRDFKPWRVNELLSLINIDYA